MPGHDIICIGASAGGIEALTTLCALLPADLPAGVFVVQHVSPQSPGLLAGILDRAGALPAALAVDDEPVHPGRIYIAPPDRHLLVEPGRVRVAKGPRENNSRPAVDPLFRSAALAYGTRVVGVVLSGSLDDGTAGLRAIKSRGGVSVVQDPEEALWRGMPESALLYAHVDHCLPLAELGPLLARLAAEPATPEAPAASETLLTELAAVRMETKGVGPIDRVGVRTPYTCPHCRGSLWELRDGELLRYRCHTGHAFTNEFLRRLQDEDAENALWAALRAIEEQIALFKRLAARADEQHHGSIADRFRLRSQERERDAEALRAMLRWSGDTSTLRPG